MDYDKTRTEALAQKETLLARQQEITDERRRLDDETDQIRRELIGLDQIIEGVEVVTSDVPPDWETPALTDHVRKVLRETTVHLLPTQIRDACFAVGIRGSSMKNLLISVHNVLARNDANLDKIQIEGKTAYKWKLIGGIQPAGSTTPPRRRARRPPPPNFYNALLAVKEPSSKT